MLNVALIRTTMNQYLKTGLCLAAFFIPYLIFYNDISLLISSNYHYISSVKHEEEKVTFINWTKTQTQMQKISKLESFQVRKDFSEGGCLLPDLDPWDPSIVEYVKDFPEVKNK